MINDYEREALRWMGRAFWIPILLIFGITGCDSLLEVSNPGSVEAEDLDNPALAQTMIHSAVGQFECAYTSYVMSTAILGQEMRDSSNWANLNGWGQRGLQLENIIGNCPSARTASALGAYAPLQQARFLARDGMERIEGFSDQDVPNKQDLLTELAAYGGFATLLLGEGFCEMALDQGPLMTREQVFSEAESELTSAINLAQAAGLDDFRLMATLARARARLNLGDMDGAASDAAQIPEGFVWYAQYSTIDGSRENRAYNMNRLNRFLSVEPGAYADLELAGQPDPRVQVMSSGTVGHDNVTEHWYQDKYAAANAPIPMASWEEAQLIIAEARPSDAEASINLLRSAQDLPEFQLEDGESMLDAILEERRRQLFLEGHRLNDMLRHDLPFPTGSNHKGQAWGPVTCMPLPEQERRNNPNIGT